MKTFKIIILFLTLSASCFAQEGVGESSVSDSVEKVIQFSGIVAEGDSLYGVAGAAVISLNSSTGTNSNLMGYFSMPVFEGDSIVVAALGYKKKYFVIPEDIDGNYSYSLMINLTTDTIELPLVDLRVFPTEEVFKEILLAMNLNNRSDYDNMENNLNARIMERLLLTSDLPGNASFKYYMDKQVLAAQRKYTLTTNPLTDPFAWARLIKDLKEYKEKKDKEKKDKIIDSRN